MVQFPRTNSVFEFHTLHAGGHALGLGTLSSQIETLNPKSGLPVAAVNGDFYQREMAYAGDPRGIQILDGELISAPIGGVTFWVDGFGQPHDTNVQSLLEVVWPNGVARHCDLNCQRRPGMVVLYTPALGPSTHTVGGREFILEPEPRSPWLPLRTPRIYRARVAGITEKGDSPLPPDRMVLSVAPDLLAALPKIETNSMLTLSTATSPGLRSVRTAIGGGPILVRNGKRQKNGKAAAATYEYSSMLERHPRSAIGWNNRYYFLVTVDGRQPGLSAGMTLKELANYMLELGCDQAMSLDGGGSAMLWFEGKVRNSPCDGRERAIANSLVIVKKPALAGMTNASVGR